MPDPTPTPPADLAVLALRYAAGDLPPEQMDAFESRLADDQPARDALAEAIRLSASALGQAPPAPSSAVRQGVRERLFPTWLTRLFPRRSYRGHPAAWAGLGGAVSAGVALFVVSFGDDPPPVQYTGTPPGTVRILPPPVPVAPTETQRDAVKRAEPDMQPDPMNPAIGPNVRAEPVPPMPPVAGPNNDVPNVGMQHGCDPSNG